jgi:hypothetical protein
MKSNKPQMTKLGDDSAFLKYEWGTTPGGRHKKGAGYSRVQRPAEGFKANWFPSGNGPISPAVSGIRMGPNYFLSFFFGGFGPTGWLGLVTSGATSRLGLITLVKPLISPALNPISANKESIRGACER